MRIARRPVALILLLSAVLVIVFSSHAFPQVSEPILTIEAGLHSASLRDMATDARNRFLVTGAVDKTVRVWDLPTGRLLGVLRPPTGKIEGTILSVAISPDGETVACGSRAKLGQASYNLFFFDRGSGRLIKRVSGLPESAQQLKFSQDGHHLAAGLWSKAGVRLYSVDRKGDTVNVAQIGEDGNYGSAIQGLDFDPAGRLAVSSMDGSIRLYGSGLKLIVKKPAASGTKPFGVSFSPDGTRIAVGYYDVPRVDILSGTDLSLLSSPPIAPSQGKLSYLSCVAWSRDGRFLDAGGFYQQEKRNVILRWSTGDFAISRRLHLPATVAIRNILPLQDGGIAYSGVNGDLGVFGENGKQVYARSPNVDRYNAKEFLISHDATAVHFSYDREGSPVARFSVETKQLELNPAFKIGFAAAITKAKGISITDWQMRADPKLNGKPLPLRERFDASCYVIAPDHQSFILGTWWYLYLFDTNGKEIWYRTLPGVPRAVRISSDGLLAVAALSDGTIRWYRMKDGRELLAFYPHSDRKRWVLWTPSGYYDASEGGDELIGWHVNNGLDREASFYPVSRFFERFYRPEVMARVIKGVEADTAVVASLGEKAAPNIETAGIKPPPEVAIVSPLPGKQFDSDELQVKIVVEDMGGGIDEVLLYQNGKILPREAGTQVRKEGSTQEHLYRVKLIEGTNQLKASAFSRDRVEGSPMEITVSLRGAEKESDLHLVVVGINRYRNAALNLTYAEPDAQGILAFFQSADVKKLFKNVYVYSAMSERATGQSIKDLFAEVSRKAQPQDTLLLYLAGHGDTIGEEWYFIPHDVVSPEIEQELKKGGISNRSISDAIKQCRAQKVFVMIDACKSGKLIIAMRSTEARKALVQLARSTGTYIVSASTDQQYAAEIKALGHGVFTYTLLEGLKGQGGEKKVTVEGLIHYVKEKLPELTEKHRGQAQYPVSWGSGMDFPLVLH